MPIKPKVLFLAPGSVPSAPVPAQEVPVIIAALALLSKVDGTDYISKTKYNGRKKGKPSNVPAKHHIIVAGNTKMAEAAKELFPTTPIVVALTGDSQLKAKLVSTYGGPDSVTGVLDFDSNQATSQVEILRKLLNKPIGALLRLAVIWNDDNPTGKNPEIDELKGLVGLQLSEFRDCSVSAPADVPGAFTKARKAPIVDAVVVLGDPITVGLRTAIDARANLSPKLPVMYSWPEAAGNNSLIGYGPLHVEVFAKAAPLVSQIIDALNAGTFNSPLPALVGPPTSKLWVNTVAAATFDPALTPAVLNARLSGLGAVVGPPF